MRVAGDDARLEAARRRLQDAGIRAYAARDVVHGADGVTAESQAALAALTTTRAGGHVVAPRRR